MYYRIKKKGKNLYICGYKNGKFGFDYSKYSHSLDGKIFSLKELHKFVNFGYSISATKNLFTEYEVETYELIKKKPSIFLEKLKYRLDEKRIIKKLKGI